MLFPQLKEPQKTLVCIWFLDWGKDQKTLTLQDKLFPYDNVLLVWNIATVLVGCRSLEVNEKNKRRSPAIKKYNYIKESK